MTLDDIRRLNIKEVGNWPLLPRAALLLFLLIVVVAAGAALVWKDQYEALDRSQNGLVAVLANVVEDGSDGRLHVREVGLAAVLQQRERAHECR